MASFLAGTHSAWCVPIVFLFDGEKIQEIAESEKDNEQLGEAIRGLLGIELVGRLRTDIGLYIARHQGQGGSDTALRLEAAVRDISAAERQVSELVDETADLSSLRDLQARAAEQIRRRFIAEGGDVAVQRAKIEAERDQVDRALGRAEHEMRELSGKLLPFTLAPKLIEGFLSTLSRCNSGDGQASTMLALRELLGRWRHEGDAQRAAKWTAKHWGDLEKFLEVNRMSARSIHRRPSWKLAIA